MDSYKQLAERLDALPNGYPATEDGIELELLANLFTLEEAACAAQLRMTPETPAQVAERIGMEAQEARKLLKGMAKKGLIEVHKTDEGLGYALMPFVVGFYEMQINRLDEDLARLMEAYFKRTFKTALVADPPFHRVIPIGETIPVDIEVQPFESAAAIVNRAQAWGVIDCICRKQKALVGEACSHPVEDICMVFSQTPRVFDKSTTVKALTHEEALQTLRRAADAGLVHTVGNHQDHESYICNCCTCSCGILRGVAELGVANVVARSAFMAQPDSDLCIGCESCLSACQFDALTLVDGVIAVEQHRCAGCGQCVWVCTEHALTLARRPEDEIKPIPPTMRDWQITRALHRGRDINDVS